MKRDWIVINTGHERYSFDTSIRLYRDKTFEELKKELCIYNDDIIEQYRDEDIYLVDECYHADLDTKYEYPQFKGQPLQKMGLEVTMIVAFDVFISDEYCSWIWGTTENKFGLLDKKRKGD